MGMEITGGTGNGFSAKVNSQNQLATAATMVTKEHDINHADGQAYSFPISVTPTLVSTPATGCIAYLKNNNDLDLIVAEMSITATSTETFQVKLGDEGTPIGGNTTTPVNRNAGSGNEADVTALTGSEITGLSGGKIVFGYTAEGGVSTKRIQPSTGYILPKNKVLTVYVTTGAIPVRFGIGITFHNQEV